MSRLGVRLVLLSLPFRFRKMRKHSRKILLTEKEEGERGRFGNYVSLRKERINKL